MADPDLGHPARGQRDPAAAERRHQGGGERDLGGGHGRVVRPGLPREDLRLHVVAGQLVAQQRPADRPGLDGGQVGHVHVEQAPRVVLEVGADPVEPGHQPGPAVPNHGFRPDAGVHEQQRGPERARAHDHAIGVETLLALRADHLGAGASRPVEEQPDGLRAGAHVHGGADQREDGGVRAPASLVLAVGRPDPDAERPGRVMVRGSGVTALCAQRDEHLVEWPGGEPGDGDEPRGAVILGVAELLVGLDGAEAVQAVQPGPAGHGPAVEVPRLAAQGRGRVDRGPAAGPAPLGQVQAGVRVGVVVVAVVRQQVVVEHPARRRRARVRPGLDHGDRRQVLQAERAEQAGRAGPDDEDVRVAAHGRIAADCGSRLASWSAMTERMCWRIRVSARCPSRWTMAS